MPEGWAWTTVAELGKVVSGGTPSTKEASYWGGDIAWISPSDLTGYTDKFIARGAKSITASGLQSSSATAMPAGSVHFSSRAPIGYTVISSRGMTTNQGFKSLVPADGVFNEYIYYYFKSAKQLAESVATGTTFKEISGSAFSKMPLPLPPTAEQHRIVAKIEELFSELDQGVASLKTAREQLKVYRQSLLKNAFEGKLTAAWRAAHRDQLETAAALQQRIAHEREARYQQQLADWQAAGQPAPKPKPPKPLPPLTAEKLAELPELPEGWGWVRLETIQAFGKHAVKAGPFGSALKKEFYVSDGFKIYGQEQVIRGDHAYGDYFISESKYADLSSCAVRPFDVLISLVGTIGKVLVLPELARPGIINPRLVKISLNLAAYEPAFFKAYFESGFLRSLYATESQGTTMDILNLGMIQGLPYPLCSLDEQREILSVLDAKLSEADQLDQTLATALQQADALRQSILKKAFHGQLVKQAKNEEPATALLEGIRAEKSNGMKKPAKQRNAG